MILVAAISLILVGLLFGFNIQVSDSVVNIIGSVGTMVGGLGAAFAAFISYRSMGQWRWEFDHAKRYELVNKLDDILHDVLTTLHDTVFSESINVRNFLGALPRSVKPYSKAYDKAHDDLRLLLEANAKNEQALMLLEQLTLNSLLSHMHEPFIRYHDSNNRINAYFAEHPDEPRSLHEIVEIKEDLISTYQTMNQLSQLDMDYRKNMVQLKSLLLSKP